MQASEKTPARKRPQHHHLAAILLLIAGSVLSACDSTDVVVARDPLVVVDPDEPRLEGFFMIDSFGAGNEDDVNALLEIDPQVEDGLFDLYWFVDSYRAFEVYITLNDSPRIDGGAELYYNTCGEGLDCREDDGLICRYFEDATMGCGFDLDEAERFREPIDFLLFDLPESLYVNIEVCDLDRYYCERDSIPVDVY